MFNSWFRKDIPAACSLCRYGRISAKRGIILCEKRGVVSPDFSCRKFSYDPIKRIPKGRPKPMEFSEEDFKL